jgi:hypothetical protein
VSGTCDTSAAIGICVEPVSTGGLDAGPLDAAAPLDAGVLDDAGSERCLPEPPVSGRSLAEAVLGAGAAATRDVAEAWVGTASAPLPVGAGGTEFAIGVRAGGPLAPRVLVAVGLGSHDVGQPEIVIRRASPFDDASSFTSVPDLDAAIQLGALSIHSGPDFANLAIVRPMPESLDAAFVWMLREGQSPQSLTQSSSTFPGRIALFEGPGVMFGRELLLLDEIRGSTHVLSLVGEPFTADNATQRELPAAWGSSTFTMSAARQAVLLHDPSQARTVLARSTGVTGAAPDLSLAEITLTSDAPPALLATADSPTRYRVVTGVADCDELPIAELTCTGSACSASPPTAAISSTSVAYAFEATSWGEASVVLLFEPDGARVVVLDAEGGLVSESIRLGTTETFEIDALSLREAHVAASVSDGVAVLVLAGLYANRIGDGVQVLVRSVRLRATP